MSDIFISYSRKDSEQALQLAELLQSASLSCWLDNQSLTPAESWSREIVSAINVCRVMIYSSLSLPLSSILPSQTR